MATNKLLEAAADILAQSKKNAPGEPMHKAAGGHQDLGGPTPQNSKPMDDSNKLNVNAPDNSAKNQASIKMHPSAASAKTEEVDSQEEVIAETPDYKSDIEALFADDNTISEDFKNKATTIFEARVGDRVSQIQEQLEEQYANALAEAVQEVRNDLTEKVNDYLNYVVEQWMEENQIAIESGLRSELTEEFIIGLRNLFAEHYIDVPEEKVDLVDELAGRVEELETKLSETIEQNIEYKKALVEAAKIEIAREVSEGLTATQAEKIKALAEGVEFSTEDEYREKLVTIRENYFPSEVKKADEKTLVETVDETDKTADIVDPWVRAAAAAISKTKI